MNWTKARIREAAEELLRSENVGEPPVPVERLARRLGAQLRYEPFEGDLSGLLFREADRVVIGVNSLHPKTRQRFTIAHELGHLVLHTDDAIHVDKKFRVRLRDEVSAQAIDPAEIAANTFAAELLMPAAMLKRDVTGHTLDFEDDEFIRSLAHRYKVSLQAMIFRLTNLGFVDLPAELSS